MADALSVILAAVLRNLSDKLYEKRKNAALEVRGIVKPLTAAGDHDKITVVINLLTHEYTYSPQANHRKGGLIGLAAAPVGSSAEATQHLEIFNLSAVPVDRMSTAVVESFPVLKPGGLLFLRDYGHSWWTNFACLDVMDDA